MSKTETYADLILEKSVLAALIQNGESSMSYYDILLPKHFTDDNVRRLFTLVRRLAITGVVPNRETLRLELISLYAQTPEIRVGLLDLFDQFLIISVQTSITYLVERLIKFQRVREMFSSMKKCVALLENGDLDASLSQYQNDALTLQADDYNLPVTRGSIFNDFEEQYRILEDKQLYPEKYKGISTGIDELDDVTAGLWKGELGFVFGKSGVGKSFFLLNCAFYGYQAGLNVLVIPIEMPAHQWMLRVYSRLSHVPYELFKKGTMSDPEKFIWRDRVNQLKATYSVKGADILVSHIPMGCTTNSIRAELEYYRREGKPIGLLIIDYADLMSPPRVQYSEQSELTAIFRELKGLASAYDIPTWTASQSKRESYSKTVLSMDDVGYAMGKVHVSDLVVGLAQTDDFRITNRMNLSVCKFRDGVYNKPIVIKTNLAIAMINETI